MRKRKEANKSEIASEDENKSANSILAENACKCCQYPGNQKFLGFMETGRNAGTCHDNNVWAVLMAEQTGFTGQRYFQRDDFPSKCIDEGWKENYYITNITWGDSNWVLIMSQGCGFTDQQWR